MAMVAMCTRAEVQGGFHVKEEPPTAVSTETRGEYPPSVLFGGVLDQCLDGWAHGIECSSIACLRGEPLLAVALLPASCVNMYSSTVQL
jgi:hypothetical protein